MTAAERETDRQLNAIGRELMDLRDAGRLDFETYKRLVRQAIAVAGTGDEVSFIAPFASSREWWDWMCQELNSPAHAPVAEMPRR
jgi:hypothetical protein